MQPPRARHTPAQAAVHFEAVLADKLGGGSRQAKLQLAWCHGLCGKSDEAMALYAAVLDDDLACLPALLDRGKLHVRHHMWEASARAPSRA